MLGSYYDKATFKGQLLRTGVRARCQRKRCQGHVLGLVLRVRATERCQGQVSE